MPSFVIGKRVDGRIQNAFGDVGGAVDGLFLKIGQAAHGLLIGSCRHSLYRLRPKRGATTQLKTIETKEQLISAISHDLRNPLGAVLVYAELLQQDPALIGRSRTQLEGILRAAHRMDTMIQNLVDLTRLESGKIGLEKSKRGLARLVGTSLDELREKADAKNIRFDLRAPSQDPELVADQDKLARAFSILVTNAIQYSPDNSVIEIEITANESHVSLRLTDHGKGMPSEDLKSYLFDGEELKARPSRGMSLYLARLIVELHGGTITASSTPGLGTSFQLSLPRDEMAAKASSLNSQQNHHAAHP